MLCRDIDKLNWSQKNFNLRTSQVTVSGFSSGGFMTANFLALFNKKVRGGAIIAAGGPTAAVGAEIDKRWYGIRG